MLALSSLLYYSKITLKAEAAPPETETNKKQNLLA